MATRLVVASRVTAADPTSPRASTRAARGAHVRDTSAAHGDTPDATPRRGGVDARVRVARVDVRRADPEPRRLVRGDARVDPRGIVDVGSRRTVRRAVPPDRLRPHRLPRAVLLRRRALRYSRRRRQRRRRRQPSGRANLRVRRVRRRRGRLARTADARRGDGPDGTGRRHVVPNGRAPGGAGVGPPSLRRHRAVRLTFPRNRIRRERRPVIANEGAAEARAEAERPEVPGHRPHGRECGC